MEYLDGVMWGERLELEGIGWVEGREEEELVLNGARCEEGKEGEEEEGKGFGWNVMGPETGLGISLNAPP